MQPSVNEQFVASTAGRIPAADQLRSGIWSIPIPMPDPRNPYTLSYVLASTYGSLTVIDPGYDDDHNWALLNAGLHGFGLSSTSIETIFITHLHPDHLGMADRVRRATGARVAMLRLEQEALVRLAGGDAGTAFTTDAALDAWGVPEARRDEVRVRQRMSGSEVPLDADVLLEAGDRLESPGLILDVVWTPGHTPGSACVIDRSRGVVFTGDHVLPGIYSGLGLGGATATNPIADYLHSLTTVDAFDEFEVAPGHGYRFTGLRDRTADIREHHLRRSREAARVIGEWPSATVFEVASRLSWTAGWERLTGLNFLSALSQTEQHLDFVRSDAFPG